MKSERNSSGDLPAAALSDALNQMWHKFLPEIRKRAQVLHETALSAAARELAQPEREAAQSAAHKLAGTLGTFGLSRGTALARELESIYAGQTGPVPADRLVAMAAEVQSIIESRK